MKISVITVCFNSSKTILDTIKSVNNQSYTEIEHIFIDGVSNDNTLNIIKLNSKNNHILISEKDSGIYDAMNKGILIANGDIICILNSDDYLKNEFVLQKVVNEFNKSGADMVYGNIDYINKKGNIVRFWDSSIYEINSFKMGWHPPHSSLFIKKIVYEKCGLFDADFKIAGDFDLMLRFFECHSVLSSYLNYTMVTMRLGGASNNFFGILKGGTELMKAFKKNEIKLSYFYLFRRYLLKIIKK